MRFFLKALNLLTKKEKILLTFTFFVSFIVMGLETIGVAIIPVIFTKIINLDNFDQLEKLPIFLTNLLNYFKSVYSLLFFTVSLFFFKSIINYFHYILDYVIIKKIRLRLTNYWFNETLNQNYLNIQNTPVSHKIWMVSVIEIATAIILNYLNLFKGIIISLSILFIIIYFSKQNLIIFYLILIFLSSLFYFFFSKKLSNYGKSSALAVRERLEVLQTVFIGIKNILIYNKKKLFSKNFFEKILDKEKNEQLNAFISGLPLYFMEFIGVLFICVYFFVNLQQGVSKSDLIFNIGLLTYGSLRVLAFFKVITSNLSLIKTRKFNISSLVDQIDIIESQKKNFNSKNQNLNYNYNYKFKDNSVIQIKNLNFSYDKNPLINIKSFSFKENSFYIIIGDSGKGKSTILDLMTNIIKPVSGEINFAYSADKIGYVSQESFILNTSIKKNIAFAEQEKEIDDEKLQDVLKKTNLNDFVDSLHEKENYVIKNNGTNLSVGQKQRIGIARALYYQPKIIFLDEPTSSLDDNNEKSLLNTIEDLKSVSTIIMVTHKYKNISKFDQLLEIKNGDLVEKKL
tara:strand:+ start:597 stop:2306 length:1710 start_codon:yes stop_codon:yes gene_type:complete